MTKNLIGVIQKLPAAILLVLLLLIFLPSCDKNRFYDQSLKIPGNGWHKDSIAQFTVDVEDNSRFYSFYINIRNNTDYDYSNFFLFLNTTLPDGELARDTIELTLADKSGKWLGKGFGRLKDNQMLVRPNLQFPMKGMYIFGIQHAMRDTILTGIENVGIRIEKW